MKPLDPRLLTYARSARGYIFLTAALGLVTAGLIVASALLIANVLGPVAEGRASWSTAVPLLTALAAVFAVRLVISGVQERFAHRAATKTIAELRGQVLRRAVELGPRWLSAGRSAEVATLTTRGLDSLDAYFVRYLPQLLLAVTVTPGTLAVVLGLDWKSAIVITITLPLVPLFMILIGRMTQAYSKEKLVAMTRLGAHVLDLIAGLPTLKALGRERGPAARVRALGEAHTKATMGTLRVAFLSGMVLELLTTLSVAVVAVEIGMRLVYGRMDLTTGLAVLILAPEVYLPLRQVGAHFHASSDGIAAAEQAFAVLEAEVPAAGTAPAPDLTRATIDIRNLGVRAPDRDRIAPADLTFAISPGELIALRGDNGEGKSTTVSVLLGLLRPDQGAVIVRDTDGREIDLRDIAPAQWQRQISWVPQRPVLVPGTIWENLAPERAADRPTQADLEAAQLTGLDQVVASLPDGWHTRIGHGGVGLSLGQRQRLALTRALIDTRPLVILDEPTAHLDPAGEEKVLAAIQRVHARGRTVVVVAHRNTALRVAERTVMVSARSLTPNEVTL